MKILIRKLWRDLIKKTKIKTLTVILITTLWVSTSAGLFMAASSLENTRKFLYDTLFLSDLQILLESPRYPEELPTINDPEITQKNVAQQKRLVGWGNIELKDGKSLPALMIFQEISPEISAINTVQILDGKGFENQTLESQGKDAKRYNVILERTLWSEDCKKGRAEKNLFCVGDPLTIHMPGYPIEAQVGGIALSPEFLFPSANPNLLTPAKGSLAVIFAPMEMIEPISGRLYNNLAFRYANSGKPNKKIEDAIRRQHLPNQAIIPRSQMFDYKLGEEFIRTINSFCPIGALIIGLVVLLILGLIAERFMIEQAEEIFILQAIGYSHHTVLIYFTMLGLFYGLISGILGILGSFPIASHFYHVVTTNTGFPEGNGIHPNLTILISSFLSGIFLILFTFGLAIVRLFRTFGQRFSSTRKEELSIKQNPNYFLRTWRFFNLFFEDTIQKYAIRNLRRHRKRVQLTLFAVALAIAVSSAFPIFYTSREETMIRFFNQDRWNLRVEFKKPLEKNEIDTHILNNGSVLEALENSKSKLEEIEGFTQGFGTLEDRNHRLRYLKIMGLSSHLKLRKIELSSGRFFSKDDALEMIVNKNLWKGDESFLKIGEEFTISSGENSYPVKLVGIVDEVTTALDYVYLPIGTTQNLFGKPNRWSGIWIRTSSEKLSSDVQSAFYSMYVEKVTSHAEVDALVRESNQTMRDTVGVLTLVCYVMAVFFLVSFAMMNIIERESEFLTLVSIGFDRWTLVKIVFIELMILGTGAILLSIPLSILLAQMIIEISSHIWFHHETVIRLSDIVGPILLAFTVIPTATMIACLYVFKRDLASHLQLRKFSESFIPG